MKVKVDAEYERLRSVGGAVLDGAGGDWIRGIYFLETAGSSRGNCHQWELYPHR